MPSKKAASKYIRQAYFTRIFGYLFIELIIISTIYESFSLSLHLPVLVLGLLLPHSLYIFSKFMDHEKSTAWSEYIDIIYFGLLATFLNWGVFPLLFLSIGICVSAITTLGFRFFLKTTALFMATIYFSALYNDFEISIHSNIYTALICAVGIVVYVSAISSNTYFQRLYLNKVRKELKEQKLKIETLALKLSKYLSPQVYNSIFLGRQDVKIETYKKPLTVFFSDIVGFTSISENMEQDKLAGWLNNYLNEMSKIAINGYSGTVDKFIGDSVMIFFGDPESKGEKEDAIQCVKMSLEMLKKSKELGVKSRMGIHSGECIVGNFGSEDCMNYTIVGGAVNLASRLESNSDTDRILISDTTYDLVKDQISCEFRGKIRVKGIDRDISTYWVIDHKQIEQ